MTDTPGPPPGNDPDDEVKVEITLPAPLPAVWQAFRDPDQLYRWFGWEYEGLEDEIKLIFFEGTVVHEPERVMDIGGHFFAFEGQGDETVVRVTRSGRAPTPDWTPDYYFDIEEGWRSFLEQLRFALARHPGDARRTLFFQGTPADDTPLAILLGLPAHEGPYTAATPWGDTLTGTTWFRSQYQVGVTVDQWGDGLAIAYQRPDRSTMVMLTTYGLSEDDRTALYARIAEWWQRQRQ